MAKISEVTRRVLIAEDEPDIREQYQEVLKAADWEVATCPDGEAVASVAKEFNPSVVLLDLRMPKKDGLEVLRDLRKSRPWTQVIIVTGHGEEEDAIRCLNEGAFHYLRKPASVLEFPELCEEALKAVPPGVFAYYNWYRALPDPDRVLFQTASGRKVSARQILQEIQDQSQDGIDFIRGVMEVGVELIATRLG